MADEGVLARIEALVEEEHALQDPDKAVARAADTVEHYLQ